MSDDCGCCGGSAVRTPATLANRPGLGQVAYRSGRHGDFLASMLAGLTRADRVALARLRTRDADDPTIALLDAWAVTCDVLTFYTERLANESYLRTAVDRASLQQLGALLSYRLNPGVAAETLLAFSLERPPVLPAPDPPDPGLLPPAVPSEIVLPVGLRVQSVPGPEEKPQTFETVAGITARPEWNSLPVVRTAPSLPVTGRSDAYLAGIGLNLRAGEALLFASDDPTDDRWDLQTITSVDEDRNAGRTHVQWAKPLADSPYDPPAPGPETLVLRQRLRVFGHNAPTWKAMSQDFRTGYLSQFDPVPAEEGDWPFFDAATTSGSSIVLDLDGSHPAVVTGSRVVVQAASGTRDLYEVQASAELSRAEFGVSGTITRLTLAGPAHTFGSPRQVTVLAGAEPLTPAEAPDDSAVSALTLVVQGDAGAMAPGRLLALSGTTTTGTPQTQALVLDHASPALLGRTELTLRTAPSPPFARAGAVVMGNVAPATHGETVTQILGSGDARVPFLATRLTQGPLTHVPADTPSGGRSTLVVRVDDVAWTEVRTAYGAGPRDRVFTTRDEPDGSLAVVFGDGAQGARPSTGSNNLRATYRKGLGVAGNLRVGQLSQALDRPLGLKGVTNPTPATGGVDPESEERARAAIPLPVRTLGRAVSLVDFADFALAFSGIGRAEARVLPLRGGSTVVVSVADLAGGIPAATTVPRLEVSMRQHGDPLVRVRVVPCRSATFRMALKVAVDPARETAAVLAAVEAALRARYGAAARPIGGAIHRSEVIAVAASVVGVVAVDLDRLYRGADPVLADRLLAAPAEVQAGEPVGAELLALAPGPLDWCKEMP